MNTLKKYLYTTLLILSLLAYGALVTFAASGPYAPGGTLDPVADNPGDCTGPTDPTCTVAITATPAGADTQIQFNDNGALGASANFIYEDNTSFLAGVTTTNSYEAQSSVGPIDLGLAMPLEGVANIMNDGADEYAFNAILDGTVLGGSGFVAFHGTNNNVSGARAALVASSDGSLFGESEPALSLSATDGSTYNGVLSMNPNSVSLSFVGETTGTQIDLDDTAIGFNGPSSGTGSSIFDFQNNNGDSMLEVSDSGIITFNEAYSFPDAGGVGNAGKSLTLSSAGDALEFTSISAPALYVENALSPFNSTATGPNGVTIAGVDNTNAGINSFIGGGDGNSISLGVKAVFIGGGANNSAEADSSFIAGGYGNSTTGVQSFASGTFTSAEGIHSSTFGTRTTAESWGEMALGTWSTEYVPNEPGQFDAGDRVFNIGNGTNNANRSDAFTVLKSGKVGIGINNFEANTNGNIFQVGDGSASVIGYVNDADGTWVDVSDRRAKKNITDLDYGLEELLQLQPKAYDFKRNDHHSIGLIAQEVKDIIPEVVSGSEDTQYGVSYSSLVPVLINAVKDLSQQISNGAVDIIDGVRDLVVRTLTADNVRAKDELCVGDICVTESQFQDVFGGVASNQISSSNDTESSEDTETDSTEPVSEDESEEDIEETATDSETGEESETASDISTEETTSETTEEDVSEASSEEESVDTSEEEQIVETEPETQEASTEESQTEPIVDEPVEPETTVE